MKKLFLPFTSLLIFHLPPFTPPPPILSLASIYLLRHLTSHLPFTTSPSYLSSPSSYVTPLLSASYFSSLSSYPSFISLTSPPNLPSPSSYLSSPSSYLKLLFPPYLFRISLLLSLFRTSYFPTLSLISFCFKLLLPLLISHLSSLIPPSYLLTSPPYLSSPLFYLQASPSTGR